MPRKQHLTTRAREEALDARLGKNLCSGWGPSAPDMSGANEAAREQAAIAKEQWRDYKENFAPVILDQMQQQIDIGKGQHDLAREQQHFQLGLARRYDDRFWNTQAPLEDQLVKEATEFNTAGERERLAGEAQADVQQAFSGASQQMNRDLGRMGVNPADPKFFSMRRNLASDQALATARAMNKVREAAKQMGWAKRMDAAALGRGLPGFSSGSSQLAMGWGGQGMQAGSMGMGAALGGLGGLNQTASSAAGTLGNASSNLRQNAIAGNTNPGFDAAMGLVSGGLFLVGSTYKRKD